MTKQSIPASNEAWDERVLGADENFVKVADEKQDALIDDSSGTQMISIRLQKTMIEDFKMIASLNGLMGYQTLMKQIMQRFVECEKKRILQELVSEKLQSIQKTNEPRPNKTRQRQPKAA